MTLVKWGPSAVNHFKHAFHSFVTVSWLLFHSCHDPPVPQVGMALIPLMPFIDHPMEHAVEAWCLPACIHKFVHMMLLWCCSFEKMWPLCDEIPQPVENQEPTAHADITSVGSKPPAAVAQNRSMKSES